MKFIFYETMKQDVSLLIVLEYNGRQLNLVAIPIGGIQTKPDRFKIILNDEPHGVIHFYKDHWISSDLDDELAELIGTCIHTIYKKVGNLSVMPVADKFSLN